MITQEDCIESIQEAADILGHSPSRPEYEDLGLSPHPTTIRKRCGNWNKAKEMAGVQTVGAGGSLSLDESFFDKIDSPESAYWLGFLYGDGTIGQHGEANYRVSLRLQEEDEKHIESFKSSLNADHKITRYDGVVGIKFSNQRISESLLSHGFSPCKTFSDSLPEIESDSLRSAFIRGLFDADGHIGQYGRFNITGASRERFEKLAEWLPVESTIVDRGDGAYTFRVGGKPQLDELQSWLYPDGEQTKPALQRKIPTWKKKTRKSTLPK